MIKAIIIFALLFLAHGDQSECEAIWKKIYNSKYEPNDSSVYSKMYQASGLTLNKIGDFESCNRIDHAKYVLIYCSDRPKYALTFCGPDVCTLKYYKKFTSVLNSYGCHPKISFPKENQERYNEYTTGAIIMITITTIIICIVIFSTIVDIHSNENDRRSKSLKILLCFSLKVNGKVLLSASRERNGKKDPLEVLNAVRVMSLGWVLLGHVCLVIVKKTIISNYSEVMDVLISFEYTFVFALYYAVNTFFWLSGFLMCFLLLSSLDKKQKMSLKEFCLIYVHRYLRLTPLAMFLLFFLWTLVPYLGNGPLWTGGGGMIGDCDEFWYTNLMYLNNMMPKFKGNKCIGVSWYLAADMQYCWIFPIVIVLYTQFRKEMGWICIGFLCIIGIIGSGFAEYIYRFSPSHLSSTESKLFDYQYTKLQSHIGPYSLGVACGFIIYSYRKHQDTKIIYDKYALYIAKTQENKCIRIYTFIAGLVLLNIIFFATYDLHHYPGEDMSYNHWSFIGNLFYVAFENIIFTLGVTLVLLPLLLGHFQPIINFMSLYFWNVLAKLSYGGYLVNYYIIRITFESQKSALILSNVENFKNIIYFFIFSIFLALPLFLCIESPATNLEKLLFERNTLIKKQSDESNPKLVFERNALIKKQSGEPNPKLSKELWIKMDVLK